MSTALLTLHMQQGLIDSYSDRVRPVVGRLERATRSARAHHLHVVHVRLAFRRGHPDRSPGSSPSQQMTMFDEHEPSSQIHEGLLRGGTDLVVVNKRGSAFKDSDLQVLLRSLARDF